jgi:hypothetical protein
MRAGKQANCIIAMAAAVGVALANAGVLQVVHLHQHSMRCSASAASQPGGKNHSGSPHDPSTCPFCIQFASGNKTASPDFGAPVTLTSGVAQNVVCFWAFSLPSVFLPSSPARAPPSICS